MAQLIEVAFKGNRKEFFLWEGETPPALRTAVIVDADRGEDLGYVHSTGELAERRAHGTAHGPHDAPIERFARRAATTEEISRLSELRGDDDNVRRRAMERVRANALQMKLTDAEWRWDRRKLTIYFTAEKRVDFRNLVRELASLFRTRIELKQIGVRDEARRLGGIGRCGREYCSASWLPELRPVNLGVAKDQRLSLNPSQISGACGRLMCCLRYEHDFYVQQRRKFPKEGKTVTTARGEEKVVFNDIFRERVTLRGVDGETRIVALGDLRQEMGSVGTTVESPASYETPAIAVEGLSDEVIRLQDTSELPAWMPRASLGLTPRDLPVIEASPAGFDDEDENDGDASDDDAEDPSAADAVSPGAAGGPASDRPPQGSGRRRRGRRGGRGGRRGGRGRGPGSGPESGGSPPPGGPGSGGTT